MSENENGQSLRSRLYNIVLDKIVTVIFLGIVAAVCGFLGVKNGLLEKLDFTDPVLDAAQEAATGEETTAEEPQIVKKTVPATSTSPIVGARNVGYVRNSKYFGASSEFVVLEPGEHEAPFTEVRAGAHTIKWSAHLKTTEGGYLGFGGDKTNWQVIGTAQAEFEQNSLYALLEDGEEDFLLENLQPLFVEAADEAIQEVNLVALRDELTVTIEPQEIVDEEEAEIVEDSEEEVDPYEKQYDRFLAILLEKAKKLFDEKYSVKLKKISVASIVELKNADLSDPHLDDATAPSMFRLAKKSTVGKMFGSSSSASGGGGGIFSTIMGTVMLFALILIMARFAFP